MNMAMMAGLEMPEGVVQLNVGGTVYLTTYDTLQRDPQSLLAQLLNPEGLEANSKVRRGGGICSSHHHQSFHIRWPSGWPTARSSLTGTASCLPTFWTICAVGNCCCPRTFGSWHDSGKRLAGLGKIDEMKSHLAGAILPAGRALQSVDSLLQSEGKDERNVGFTIPFPVPSPHPDWHRHSQHSNGCGSCCRCAHKCTL